jgi:hypothetical protein
MTMVTRYTTAMAGSAFLTALALGAAGAVPADLLLQPYFWVATLSLTGLSGLAMGNGIGGAKVHRGPAKGTAHAVGLGVPA